MILSKFERIFLFNYNIYKDFLFIFFLDFLKQKLKLL